MPLGDIFTTEVSLEEYVIGTARFVPPLVWAEAVNESVPPSTREPLPAGFSVIFPGNRGVFFLPPPHPAMLPSTRIATANRGLPERNLPMHPLRTLPAFRERRQTL